MNEGSGGFLMSTLGIDIYPGKYNWKHGFFLDFASVQKWHFCRYPRWCQKFMHLATISCTFISTNDNELGKSTQCIPDQFLPYLWNIMKFASTETEPYCYFLSIFLWFCTLVFNIAMQNYPFEQAIIFLKWAITIAAAMFSWTRRLWILKLPRSWRQGLPTSRRLHPPATSGEHLACSGSQNVRKVTKFSRNFTCAMVKQQMIAHVKRQYLVGINREIFLSYRQDRSIPCHPVEQKEHKVTTLLGRQVSRKKKKNVFWPWHPWHTWPTNPTMFDQADIEGQLMIKAFSFDLKKNLMTPLLLVDVGCILPRILTLMG